jgi:hypothetical protein
VKPDQTRWRVSPLGRIGAALAILFWFGLALGLTVGGEAIGPVAFVWLFLLAIAVCAWSWAFVPYVDLTLTEVIVQNRIRKTSLPYTAIREIRPGYYGLRFITNDGRALTAWAVQKSNAATWMHRRTRADDLADVIRGRLSGAGPT